LIDINIRVIPHSAQRYDTVGDWYYEGPNKLFIRVSELGDWRMEVAVAVHELVEWILCERGKITESEVDRFDKTFEGDGEPGDDPRAPYHRQHCIATGIERILIALLGVSWKVYDDKVNSLQHRQ